MKTAESDDFLLRQQQGPHQAALIRHAPADDVVVDILDFYITIQKLRELLANFFQQMRLVHDATA